MKDNGVHARDTGDDRVRAHEMSDERVDARDMHDERVYARGMDDNRVHARGGRMQMPRSRGAASGFLLVLLGAWGALIPFVGPYFDWAFTPDQEWVWTTGRGWLEVLPGAVTALGGLLLLSSRNRFTAMFGGWLSVLAGAWFVVGRALAGLLAIGDAGTPVAATDAKRVALDLTYFYGLGALIIFLGAIALGRLSIRSARDIRYAHRTAMNSMATTAEPPASDDVTEIQPAQTTPEPRHRPWGNVFGRGSRLAHR